MGKPGLLQQGWVFYLLAFLACLPSLMMMQRQGWFGDPRFFNDATAFYCAGHLALTPGADPYSFPQQHECSQHYGRKFSSFFYPPVVLPLLSLWSELPYAWAMGALLALSVLSLGYVYHGLYRLYLDGRQIGLLKWPLILWLGLSQLTFIQLPFGQINFIAMALCLLVVRSLLSGGQILSGMALAMVAALKAPFAVLGLALAFLGSTRAVLYAMAGLYLLALCVFSRHGLEQPVIWTVRALEYVSYRGLVEQGHLPTLGRDNVSLFALFYRLWGFEAAIRILAIAAPLLLVGVASRLWQLRHIGQVDFMRLSFAVLPALAYLLSSLSWRAYFVFLLPLAFWLLRDVFSGSRRIVPLALLLPLILSHELGHFMPGTATSLPTVVVLLSLLYALIREKPVTRLAQSA